jgi:hypothetical protein
MTAKDTNVGKDTEQRLARWLREHGGFPHAERTVRTGYRVSSRSMADAGDIDGCPGLAFQAKSLRPADRAERAVPDWLLETEAQRQAAGADIGVLVVRRWGTTDVGRWWAFLPLPQLAGDGPFVPVRLELAHAVAYLHRVGYGCPDLLTSATRDGESA